MDAINGADGSGLAWQSWPLSEDAGLDDSALLGAPNRACPAGGAALLVACGGWWCAAGASRRGPSILISRIIRSSPPSQAR